MVFGGRFYNRNPRGQAALHYSIDQGKTWIKAWEATNPESRPPWDLMHYQTVSLPGGVRSVLLKYSLWRWGLYALRAEGNYRPGRADVQPLEVTFTWTERHGTEWGKGLVQRSHTQLVDHLPFRYCINVGGDDLPQTDSLQVNLKGAVPGVKYGYADGKDVGGARHLGQWVTYGKNLAVGKSFEASLPSVAEYNAAPFEKKVLTDGIVGPCHLWSWSAGHLWRPQSNPTITLDLGSPSRCAALGLNFLDMGDLLRNNLAARTRIEVLVSDDNRTYRSLGPIHTQLRLKDRPVNIPAPDDGSYGAFSFFLVPEKPVTTRWVRFRVNSPGFFCCTELFALDAFRAEPFDFRLTLPDE